MLVSRVVSLCCAIAVLVIAPVVASAYVIKTSSSGASVHWTVSEVELTPAFVPGPSSVTSSVAQAATAAAATTWRTALAGTVDVVESTTVVAAAPHGNDGVNLVRWAIDKADPDIEHGVLALTFVAYRVSDGVIEDADIVLNSADFAWVTAGAGCKTGYDLESAMTHELGHALGLAHSADHDATMFATGGPCEVGKRDLTADDQAGIDELYPAPVPMPMGGCSAGGGSGGLAALIGFALIAVMRKSRAAAAGLIVVGLAATADASQLRRLELADLGHDAALVVRGHVVAVTTSADGELETDSELVVDECLAGACPATVQVRRRGGERGDVGLWVDGEAAPTRGEEVIVYLRRDARGQLRVLGGVQGLLHVVTVRQGVFAVRDLRGHHVQVGDSWQAGALEVTDLAALQRSLPSRTR